MVESKALEALFPGLKRLVIRAMFIEPARWWSLPELAGMAGAQPGAIRRHLLQLRQGGVIRQREEDGRAFFQPDPGCLIFSELQAIVEKLTRHIPGGETILVVEDQPATAQITHILLESWGYTVLEAHDAEEAIAIFESRGDPIHLLLTDVIMPGMTGPQLAEKLLRREPDLRVVFMSGYPNQELGASNAAFLPKPFNPASLSQVIRCELDRETRLGYKPA